jgi:two-component system chemotaxis sensor kinase CheA
MDDLISEFLTETNESLEELDQDLVTLEQNPNDKDLLGKIFRLKHTIKGTCGFLGLPRLEKVAHHAENVLGRFRDGDLEVTPEYVTLIFESIDRIKLIVRGLETTGKEPDGDDSALIAKLDEVYLGKPAEAAAPPPPPPVDKPMSEGTGGVCSQAELDALEAAFQAAPGPAEFSQKPAAVPTVAVSAPIEQPKTPAKAEAAGDDSHGGGVTQTLRVNVDVLENLMTIVSELVLTRNQLLQILRASTDSDFSTPLQRLNHVVSELQDGVMKTRMQPIGAAWSKLPRIIRDLSMELGKKIDLEMRGQDTELDRQVLELIKDPLTHMVRNSGDHGIEDPATRKALGKPETGKIILNAYHEGGHILIQISDDGKGLPMDRIKQKIIEKNLATESELAEMSATQIQQFIFKAGFSTAEKVTSVSGRGVGMDVVRTNIEKIGGSIELRSKEGQGSTFTIKIPLTLAIVSALIVEASGEKFAIPQLAVRELVMASTTGENRIEMIKGTPVFRLREHLLPLVSLSELLKLEIPSREKDKNALEDITNAQKTQSRHEYIIVTQVGPNSFGIIVDRVYDTEEIVVKPVAKILRNIELFSGNTILGDGSVIMILDPNGIVRQIGEVDADSKADIAAKAALAYAAQGLQKTSLLLFEAGNQTPKAVPLSLVARLENIDLAKIERSGGQMMVQYREQLMPLVPFDSSIVVGSKGEKPVLVFSDKKRSMGLIVDKIIDITEEHIDVQLDGGQRGILGSAIIDNKATDVVDVGHFLQTTYKEWFKDHGDDPYGSANAGYVEGGKKPGTNGSGKKRILVVDDSPFFRNMLTPLLSVAGYEVVSLESPQEALRMCDNGAEFDVIISDIEMPDMDGFAFAEKVRSGTNWKNTPMVALSSHATPQDIARGHAVGFSKYVAKFDRDTLLNTLAQTLTEQRLAHQNKDIAA